MGARLGTARVAVVAAAASSDHLTLYLRRRRQRASRSTSVASPKALVVRHRTFAGIRGCHNTARNPYSTPVHTVMSSTASSTPCLTPSPSPTPRYPVQPDHFYGPEGQPARSVNTYGRPWLDPEDDPLAQRGIPVFKPTMDEFRDFEAYMNRVEC